MRSLSFLTQKGCLLFLSGLALIGVACAPSPTSSATPVPAEPSSTPGSAQADGAADASGNSGQTTPAQDDIQAILQESWEAYKTRFIQADGRVIDWEADARTVSEGQAYAMLRAVLIDDPDTFERTLNWAENNLQRQEGTAQLDSLWAWTWGQKQDGTWGIQDVNFASDADVDAIAALILASRRWNRPDYLALARTKLEDLWNESVWVVGDRAYLLPGPITAFRPDPGKLVLNPSYLFPSAFRLFAQVDPDHDWMRLVDTSYTVLNDAATVSAVELPSDWVQINAYTGRVRPLENHPTLTSKYGFDAYRVWWRIALDALWFEEERATDFLQDTLPYITDTWERDRRIMAEIDLQGAPLVEYEATAQYAMLYPALLIVDSAIATELFDDALFTTYTDGIWDGEDFYYVQNLAWFGLAAPTLRPQPWLASD
ncbi:MAG: glycosyl hydrolase family 8 [Cyanobacteria bacterium J06638_20]